MIKVPYFSRSSTSSAAERFHQEEERHDLVISEYLSKNKVNDFDDFKTKIKKESLLTGFTLVDVPFIWNCSSSRSKSFSKFAHERRPLFRITCSWSRSSLLNSSTYFAKRKDRKCGWCTCGKVQVKSSALKDELLSLPSICHLKRFSQSLTVEAGFSKAIVKYLKQRASYLKLRQKLCCLTKSIAPCAACCEFRLRWRWRNFKNCALFHEYRDCASSYRDIVTSWSSICFNWLSVNEIKELGENQHQAGQEQTEMDSVLLMGILQEPNSNYVNDFSSLPGLESIIYYCAGYVSSRERWQGIAQCWIWNGRWFQRKGQRNQWVVLVHG